MAEKRKPETSGKRVDEHWKEEVEKEKHPSRGREKEVGKKEKLPPPPPADFGHFVAGLAIQGIIFLGEMENPATGKKEKELQQAKYIIDTLDMLKQKTGGNLTEAEGRGLENLLYDLRMRYVKAAGQGEG